MSATPLRPATRASQKASRELPNGVTAPMPVMTTRRFSKTSRDTTAPKTPHAMPRFPAGPGSLEAFRGMLPARGMSGFPDFFRKTAARYGPVASSRFGRNRFFYVSEPALIEDVLVTSGRSYIKGRGTQRLERLLGKGLLTSNGALHLRQRRLVQPAFHRERIAGYAATMVARAEDFAARLSPDQPVEMVAAMHRLTLGIAAETLFGADIDHEAETIGHALHRVAMESFPISLTPIGEHSSTTLPMGAGRAPFSRGARGT